MSNQAGLGLGDKVHTQEINEYPEDLKQEYLYLSTWVKAVAAHYGRNIVIRVVDPQSLMGFWKLLRFGIRRYPVFILEGEQKLVGWEAEEELHDRLRAFFKARNLPQPPQGFSLAPKISLVGDAEG